MMLYCWSASRLVRQNVDCELLLFCAEIVVNHLTQYDWLAIQLFICKSIRFLYNSVISSPNYIILPTFLAASLIVYYCIVFSYVLVTFFFSSSLLLIILCALLGFANMCVDAFVLFFICVADDVECKWLFIQLCENVV